MPSSTCRRRVSAPTTPSGATSTLSSPTSLEPLRQIRIVEAQALCIHAAADRERAVTSGAASVPFELFANALLDGIASFLSAPASDATQRQLKRAGDVDQRRLRLL